MKRTVGDFQQMIQERLNKVEEIKNCLKLSTVSPDGNVYPCHKAFGLFVICLV